MPAPLPELIALSPYVASAGLSLAIAVACWRNQQTPGARAVAVIALITALVSTGYVLELVSPGLDAKRFWDSLQWIVALEAVPLLAFAISFAGLRARWPLIAFNLLLAPPLVFIVYMVTNPLAYPDARLIPGEPFGELAYTFIPLIYLIAGYNFSLALASIVLLI